MRRWVIGLASLGWVGCLGSTLEATRSEDPARSGQPPDARVVEAFLAIESARGTEKQSAMNLEYGRALGKAPEDVWLRLLWAYSLEDTNDAYAELEKTLKLDGRCCFAILAEATLVDGWNLLDVAEKRYLDAIRCAPGLPLAHARLGRMYLRRGELARALSSLDLALKGDPHLREALLARARALARQGRRAESAQAYREVLTGQPSCQEALTELAALMIQGGENQQALALIERAVGLDAQSYPLLYQRAQLLLSLDRPEDALGALKVACGLREDSLPCWHQLAEVAERLGRSQERMSALERVIELDPGDLPAHRLLAPVFLRNGDIEKALVSFEIVLAQAENDLDALAGLAEVYERGGDYFNALEVNQRLLVLEPGHEQARAAAARLFERFHVAPEAFTGDKPNQVFYRNRVLLEKVYKLRLRENPRLGGTILMQVKVLDSGEVERVDVMQDSVGDPVLDLCAVWNLRRSRFPKGFGAIYNFELSLKPVE